MGIWRRSMSSVTKSSGIGIGGAEIVLLSSEEVVRRRRTVRRDYVQEGATVEFGNHLGFARICASTD